MQAIKTELTRLLGIETPILSAPMGFAWSADLACAVNEAGGFGFTGAAFDSSSALRERLTFMRTRLGVDPGKVLPIGVGFLGWVLDKTEVSDDPRIPAVLDELPKAIYFAFGEDLGRYVHKVREYEADRAHKTLVFVCVHTVAEALVAANEWHADVLVVQGTEAGGHQSSYSAPLTILLTAVLAALPHGPPIVAAGGVATGAQAAALLTLGAAGVLLGTRLLFTDECRYAPCQKAAIVAAGLGDAVSGTCFDEAMGLEWPRGVVGQALRNGVWRDAEEGLGLVERRKRYEDGLGNGDPERVITWAGKAVGLTREIRPAREVVEELHRGAVQALRDASLLL